jgi:hypothetical protein
VWPKTTTRRGWTAWRGAASSRNTGSGAKRWCLRMNSMAIGCQKGG